MCVCVCVCERERDRGTNVVQYIKSLVCFVVYTFTCTWFTRSTSLGEISSNDTTANSLVNESGAILSRKHHPHKKAKLERKIKRNPVQDNVCEMFKKTKEREYDPVCQPLRVIVLATCLQCDDTGVRGIHETNQIAQKSCTKDKVHDKKSKDSTTTNNVHWFSLCFFTQVFEDLDFQQVGVEFVLLDTVQQDIKL